MNNNDDDSKITFLFSRRKSGEERKIRRDWIEEKKRKRKGLMCTINLCDWPAE